MNGEPNHGNYWLTKTQGSPSANLRTLDGAQQNRRSFGFLGRLCIWCEEVTIVRLLERTGALWRSQDEVPMMIDHTVQLDHLSAAAQRWHARWVEELRPRYWSKFRLDDRIIGREAWYSQPNNMEYLASDLVSIEFDGDLSGTDLMLDIATGDDMPAMFGSIATS